MSAPESGFVRVLDLDIPYRDEMLTGEVIALERLIQDAKHTGVESNLETVRILAKHRLGRVIKPADYLEREIDFAELDERVNELIAPFLRGMRDRQARRSFRLESMLTSAEALRRAIEAREAELEELRAMLEEREAGVS